LEAVMRALLGRIHLWLTQFGIHPRDVFRSLAALPWYIRDLRRFRAGTRWSVRLYPCLLDRSAAAATLGEYFWQDLYVARRIIEAAPTRHVDVGSRIDGFIAHLACQRTVEIYDIRPLELDIPNVRFRRWDLTGTGPGAPDETADCVSCLHTLEHLGLGRYGDRVEPDAWQAGLARLAGLVAPGGQLWLSVPVGRRRVEFNAHRVFDPRELRDSAVRLGLSLHEFSIVDDGGTHQVVVADADWDHVADKPYALGMYLFRRPAAA
jgi:Caenorhabditis protein of unknown function, DUF268